ncbi:MAG: hypothetical protein WBC71_06025 [Salaquimonas sp.]
MGLSPTLLGFLIGLGLAIVPFFVLGNVIAKGMRNGADRTSFAILDLVRKADLIIIPLVGAGLGYFGLLDGVFAS